MKLLYPILTLVLLPLIAIAWLLGKMIRPFKKSSSNGMIYLEHEGEKRLYSPYFEFERSFEDTGLLIKVVFTLSNEGIIKNTHAPLTKQAQNNPKKALFREATLFFINQSETPMEIAPKFLEIDKESIHKLDDTPQLVAAGHYIECEPVMAKDSRATRSYKVKVVFEKDKKMYEMEGEATRLSVAQMNEKYAKESSNE